jgi:sec-independent protein translocase protein TatA
MFGLGPMELVIVFLVILLVFGAKRIPEIAQGLGKGITEFKKAARDVTSELDVSSTANRAQVPPPPVRNELREDKRVENSPQQSAQSEQPRQDTQS